MGRQIYKNPQPTTLSVFFFLGKIYKLVKDCKCFLLSKNSHPSIHDKCQLFRIKGAYQGSLSNHNLCLLSVFTNSSINKLAFVTARYNICGAKVRCFPGGGAGHSHTLPIRVCAAQRGRDFEAPGLERGIHFRGDF